MGNWYTKKLSNLQGVDFIINGIHALLCHFQIIACLQIKPKLRRGIKVPCQSKGGINTDSPFLPNHVIHSRGWYTQSESQSVNAHTQRLKVFMLNDFAGVNRSHFIHCFTLLMVINYFYISRFISPYKTHAPLFIDSNTMLPLSVTAQLFKLVARR